MKPYRIVIDSVNAADFLKIQAENAALRKLLGEVLSDLNKAQASLHTLAVALHLPPGGIPRLHVSSEAIAKIRAILEVRPKRIETWVDESAAVSEEAWGKLGKEVKP